MALEFLYFIDPDTVILGLLFVIFFAIINWATVKAFKNKGTSAIIALCVSALIIYGLYKSNLDFSGFFYSLGLTEDLLYTVVPILIIVALIILSRKFGFRKVLLILGIILIGLSLTNLVYEKGIIFSIGIALILLNIIIWFFKRKKKDNYMNSNKYYDDLRKQQNKAQIRNQRREQRGYEQQKRRQAYLDNKYQKEELRNQRREQGRQRQQQEAYRQREEQKQQEMYEAQRREQEKRDRQIAEEERKREEQRQQEMYEQQRREQKEYEKAQKEAQQKELTQRQKQREKDRKAGLREIAKQKQMISRQLNDPRISDHSKEVLRQRMRDLEDRRKVFLRYGRNGNI